jgi:hypothetical protein
MKTETQMTKFEIFMNEYALNLGALLVGISMGMTFIHYFG